MLGVLTKALKLSRRHGGYTFVDLADECWRGRVIFPGARFSFFGSPLIDKVPLHLVQLPRYEIQMAIRL